jgi:hypothetical protein
MEIKLKPKCYGEALKKRTCNARCCLVVDTRNYVAAETLKDGTPVTIRAIGKDDRVGVLAAFKNLDPESVYTRFFTYKSGLTETDLQQLTEVDPYRVIALVVTTPIGQ